MENLYQFVTENLLKQYNKQIISHRFSVFLFFLKSFILCIFIIDNCYFNVIQYKYFLFNSIYHVEMFCNIPSIKSSTRTDTIFSSAYIYRKLQL